MVSTHPTFDMISACAAGRASNGVALLVSAHMTFCARCRDEIARLESLGGALFAMSEPSEVAPGMLDALMERIEAHETSAEPVPETAPADALPAPIRAALGVPFSEIRWRFRIPGVSEAVIAMPGDEKVSLLRVRPGAGVPKHTHTAVEATLVLSGALLDRGIAYRAGDVAIATEADDHRPRAGEDEDCICLAVLSGGLRFTGPFGRALNILAE